jgi:hypothetical protein
MGKKTFIIGAMVATGAILLVPGVAAAVARASRPFIRSAVKNGSTMFDEFKMAGAEAYEHFEDVFAEVRAEMEEQGSAAAAASTAAEEADEPKTDKA